MTELDAVRRYGLALGLSIKAKTVLVEGTTDVALFTLAEKLNFQVNGERLLDENLAIIAAGERDRGGCHGVVRELIALRSMGRTCLLENGAPAYRFIGLFDNDAAGRGAVKLARTIDTSITEFRDVFRLFPAMPIPGNLVPEIVRNSFERENNSYKELDWELEDLLPNDMLEVFLSENPNCLARSFQAGGKTHRDLTSDGKARLHRFVHENATLADLADVLDALRSIRRYLNL